MTACWPRRCSRSSSSAVGLYQSQRGISLLEELRTLFLGWLLIALAGGVFVRDQTGTEYSRAWAGIWLTGGLSRMRCPEPLFAVR